MSTKNEAAPTASREITATRVFDAPRELVFDAWTDPVHISNWWGPVGYTTTTKKMEVRPGGVWEHVMHGPNGVDHESKIVYVELARPGRLVYDHVNPPLFRSTSIFEDLGGKTRLSVTLVFESAEVCEQVAKKHGAVEGLVQMLSRLGEQLGKSGIGAVGKGKAASGPVPDELTLVRTLDAPRDLVFEAWTDPGHLSKWWGPAGFTTDMKKWDARAGGAILLDMNAPYGEVYPMGGSFVEVAPPSRLVFKSSAIDKAGRAIFEILNTVTLVEDGMKTELTLHTRVISKHGDADQYLKGQKEGWTQSLDRLEALVTVVGR